MARSLLGSFVSGTRQMLAVQLFVSVGAVALAGYTVGVTNNVIRERDELREHVRQLETQLADLGVTPPAFDATPPAPEGPPVYPGEAEEEVVVTEGEPQPEPEPEPAPTPPPAAETETIEETPRAPSPSQLQPEPQQPVPQPEPPREAPPPERPSTQQPNLDAAAQLLLELLTPPPALSNVVIHVQRPDYDEAQRVAAALAGSNLRVSIAIMGPEDQTATGYAYYHGRQSRPAADVARRIQDAARSAQIAPWAVQLRGTALPAQGDYTADRLDVVLPALPQTPPTILRVNPNAINRAVIAPPVSVQQQTDPNAPR